MSRPYDGGQAFPARGPLDIECADGMSYRMWLAGLALQGYVTQPQDSERSFEETAKLVVRQADALIAALGLTDPCELPLPPPYPEIDDPAIDVGHLASDDLPF